MQSLVIINLTIFHRAALEYAQFCSRISTPGRSVSVISHFLKFLQKENSFKSLIVIFENSFPKGLSLQNMKKSEISFLSADS